MAKVILRPGTHGLTDVEGDVPKSLQNHLVSELSWMGATDLANGLSYYTPGEGVLYSGCIYRFKKIADAFIADRELDLTVEIAMPEPEPRQFEWEFSTAHLTGGKPNPARTQLQKELVDKLVQYRYGIGYAVPGFGKTVAMADIIARVGLTALVVVEAIEPLEQAIKEIEGCLGVRVGKVSAMEPITEPINVMTIQTFDSILKQDKRNLLKPLLETSVIIIDECHNAAADRYLVFLQNLTNPKYIIGLSATPYRHDDRADILYSRIGDIVFECPYATAVDADILVPMYLFVEKVPEVRYGYAEQRGVSSYHRQQQYRKVVKEQVYLNKTRNRMCLDFCDYAWDEGNASCAIITDSIPHIEELCRMDKNMVGIHGKTPAKVRREVWEKLKRREITRIVTTLMDEAVNIQSLGAIVYAAPGRSKVSLIQRQRQLRTFDGATVQGPYKKEFGMVYFPYDTTDFLKSQSDDNLKILREDFIDAHHKCMFYDMGEYGK